MDVEPPWWLNTPNPYSEGLEAEGNKGKGKKAERRQHTSVPEEDLGGNEAGGPKGKGKDSHAEAFPGSWFGPKRDSPRQVPTQGLSTPTLPETKGPNNVKEWLGSTEPQSARPTEQRKGENTGKRKGSPPTHSSANRWLEQGDQPQGQGKQGQSKRKDHMTGGGKGSDMYSQHSNQVFEWSDVGPTRPERTEMLLDNFPRGSQAQVVKLWAKDKLVALGIQD